MKVCVFECWCVREVLGSKEKGSNKFNHSQIRVICLSLRGTYSVVQLFDLWRSEYWFLYFCCTSREQTGKINKTFPNSRCNSKIQRLMLVIPTPSQSQLIRSAANQKANTGSNRKNRNCPECDCTTDKPAFVYIINAKKQKKERFCCNSLPLCKYAFSNGLLDQVHPFCLLRCTWHVPYVSVNCG